MCLRGINGGHYFSPRDKLQQSGERRELTKLAYIFWQILTTNILPHMGHLNELSTLVAYTLSKIIIKRKIYFPILIFNNLFRCQNARRACLSYKRVLTTLLMKARKNFGRPISSTFCPKTLDHNGVFYKLTFMTRRGRMIKAPRLWHNQKFKEKKKSMPIKLIFRYSEDEKSQPK